MSKYQDQPCFIERLNMEYRIRPEIKQIRRRDKPKYYEWRLVYVVEIKERLLWYEGWRFDGWFYTRDEARKAIEELATCPSDS